jgi:asparagine synthetase B (glutamine-hydrolysing)
MAILVYFGSNQGIRAAARGLAEANNKKRPGNGLIHQDDHVIMVNTNRPQYESVASEIMPDRVWYIEGIINKNIQVRGIPTGPVDKTEDLIRGLPGIFNVIVWDRREKRGWIANDRLGLNPLYLWREPGKGLIAATGLADIAAVTGMAREIDEIALSQFGLFNYILDHRTFMREVTRLPPACIVTWENGRIQENIYWHPDAFFRQPAVSEEDLLRAMPGTFLKVLDEWTQGRRDVGILLSGGYDSRMILAGLMELGIKGKAYTWDNPVVKETDIAKKLAEAAGFRHTYLPYYPPDNTVDQIVEEVQQATGYIFPLFHIGRYHAVRMISKEIDLLFSGQGEMIRVTPVPNDYINNATVDFLNDHNSSTADAQSFFNFNRWSGSNFHFDINASSGYSRIEKMFLFLLTKAYRDDYGILRFGESRNVPVAMPYLDSRVIELLLTNPLSIAKRKSWEKNLMASVKSRRIYLAVIKKFAPSLLAIHWDRGYPPVWDAGYRGFLMTAIWGVKSMLNLGYFSAHHQPSPWRIFVQKILNEKKTLDRPFFNPDKIVRSLGKNMLWGPVESYELEKAVRFELWFRNHIEIAQPGR